MKKDEYWHKMVQLFPLTKRHYKLKNKMNIYWFYCREISRQNWLDSFVKSISSANCPTIKSICSLEPIRVSHLMNIKICYLDELSLFNIKIISFSFVVVTVFISNHGNYNISIIRIIMLFYIMTFFGMINVIFSPYLLVMRNFRSFT